MCYIGAMKVLFEVICLILNLAWSILVGLLKLIPVYRELSNLKQNIIAAAIGVSPVVIGAISFFIKIVKRALDK